MRNQTFHLIIQSLIGCLLVATLSGKQGLAKFRKNQNINNTVLDASTRREIEASIQNGLQWLLTKQLDNGSWNNYPAITGLVLSAFMRSHPNMDAEHPVIQSSYNYLKSCIKYDGSIHRGNMPTYNTAICLMAFKDSRLSDYDQIIVNAERYLRGVQIDEGEGLTTDSLFYGGVGDGGDDRPDLSNLHWALEAVWYQEPEFELERPASAKAASRAAQNELYFERALQFLARCQNLESTNPEDYSGNDGGFMYEPGSSKAGGSRSYGSMTYAGMKSMIYARLGKDNPRVSAAFNWIVNNYSIETTPFMDDQGLFYYYQTMAKTLSAYDEDYLIDSAGIKHNWRLDLADQLLESQNEGGWWKNSNGRWWENDPVLVTAYCILALEELL